MALYSIIVKTILLNFYYDKVLILIDKIPIKHPNMLHAMSML